MGGAWLFSSTISAQTPLRRRARRCLGFAMTCPSASRPCLALKDLMRSRLYAKLSPHQGKVGPSSLDTHAGRSGDARLRN